MLALLIKKTIILLALVGPLNAVPLFLQATSGLDASHQQRYARSIGLTVLVALLSAGLLGNVVLDAIGLSLGGMRVGGGILVLILAIAMVLGQEKAVKQSAAEAEAAAYGRGIVPLGIPLLAGPAALSYMMSQGISWHLTDLVSVIVPPLAVGAVTWLTFHSASRFKDRLTPAALNVVERLTGFLLAGLAIEMMATGLRELFPVLAVTSPG